MELQQLLTETAQRKASDLHLKPGSKPILRIHGHLEVQDDLPQVTREFIDAVGITDLMEAVEWTVNSVNIQSDGASEIFGNGFESP